MQVPIALCSSLQICALSYLELKVSGRISSDVQVLYIEDTGVKSEDCRLIREESVLGVYGHFFYSIDVCMKDKKKRK